jgi:hypothetical protein
MIASRFVEGYALDRAITTEQRFRDGPSRGKEKAVVDVEAFKESESNAYSLSVNAKER